MNVTVTGAAEATVRRVRDQGRENLIMVLGTGCCDSGCWVSPQFRQRHTFRLLKLMHGISSEALRQIFALDELHDDEREGVLPL